MVGKPHKVAVFLWVLFALAFAALLIYASVKLRVGAAVTEVSEINGDGGGGGPTLTITNVQATNITRTSAQITWDTNLAASSQVESGTTPSYGSQTAEFDTSPRATSHLVGLTGLTCGTSYNFRVKSRDDTGNLAVSGNSTFSTLACLVGQTPPPSGTSNPPTTTTPPSTLPPGTTVPPPSTTTPPRDGTPTTQVPPGGPPSSRGGKLQPPSVTADTRAPTSQAADREQPPAASGLPATPATSQVGPSRATTPVSQPTRIARKTQTPIAALAASLTLMPLLASYSVTKAAAATTGVTMQPLLARLLPYFLFGFFNHRRRPPWGVVIDQATESVIPGAAVELVETTLNRTVERTLTDELGRFVMLVKKPGSYLLRVRARGYQLWQSAKPFVLKDPAHYVPPGITIGLIAQALTISTKQLSRIAVLQAIARGLEAAKIPVLIAGLVATGLVVAREITTSSPTIPTALIGLLYLVLLLNELRLLAAKRPYGQVIDARTIQPLELAIVRAFEVLQDKKRLTRSVVTDPFGRFSFLVTPGSYRFDFIKPNYLSHQTSVQKLEGARTFVNQQIKLEQRSSPAAPRPAARESST